MDNNFSFGTLWQEATNAVGVIGNTIVNSITARETSSRLNNVLFNDRTIQGREQLLNKKARSNFGFYLVVIIIIITTGLLIYKSK